MARYRDRRGVGRSTLVPYRPDESAQDRHERRLQANLGRRRDVERWAAAHGATVRVTNEGHHWVITHRDWIAEWWPSSAKLVFEKQYRAGIHVHDTDQLIRELERRWFRDGGLTREN